MRVAEMESGTEMGRDRQHKDQMRGTQTDEDGMGWDGSGKAVQVEYVCVCGVCQTVIAASQHPSTASEQSEVFSKAMIQTGEGEEVHRWMNTTSDELRASICIPLVRSPSVSVVC